MPKILKISLSVVLCILLFLALYYYIEGIPNSSNQEIGSSIETEKKVETLETFKSEQVIKLTTDNEIEEKQSQDLIDTSDTDLTNQKEIVSEEIKQNSEHADSKKGVEPSRASFISNNKLVIALALCLVVSFIMIFVLFFSLIRLYKWRLKITGSENSIILPEAHFEKLENMEEGFLAIVGLVDKLGKAINHNTEENKKHGDQTIESYSSLQSLIDSQQEEISRLRLGYDNDIKKNFVTGLLSLRDRIQYYVSNDENSEELISACKGMLSILDNSLESQNILPLTFDSGLSIREIEGFEIQEKVVTSDKDKIGVVIKTIKPGYYLKGLEEEKIIVRNALIECYVEE